MKTTLFTRLALGVTFALSALTFSSVASAHDRGWKDDNHREWKHHHGHREHWHRNYYSPRETVRVYERDRYVVPSYDYRVVESRPRYNDGLTIIYRDNWR